MEDLSAEGFDSLKSFLEIIEIQQKQIDNLEENLTEKIDTTEFEMVISQIQEEMNFRFRGYQPSYD